MLRIRPVNPVLAAGFWVLLGGCAQLEWHRADTTAAVRDRDAAECTAQARSEALRRNRSVQFTLTNSLDASCAASLTGTSWVVSLADPTGACGATPSETAAPQILQKRSGLEGSPNATVTATGSSSIVFNGVGRIIGYPSGGVAVDVKSTKGACQDAAGSIRCLKVNISASGAIRMCDPVVSDVADPRKC